MTHLEFSSEDLALSKANLTQLSEFLETLDQPLAICDAAGHLLCLNQKSRTLLGFEPSAAIAAGDILLHISSRETFSSKQRFGHLKGDTTEFFMADVQLTNAPRAFVSVSFVPMDFGGFRVRFIEEHTTDSQPSVRLLKLLGEATQHMVLFDDATRVLSLFGSCLRTIFDEHAFRLELRGVHTSTKEEAPSAVFDAIYPGEATRRESTQKIAFPDERDVPRLEMFYRESRWGQRALFVEPEQFQLCLQFETRSSWGLSEDEQEALEIFLHTCGFMMRRHTQRAMQSSARGVSTSDELPEILNHLDAIVLWCDARRRITTCNHAFEALTGQPLDALLGTDVLSYVVEGDVPQTRAWLASTPDKRALLTVDLLGVDGEQAFVLQVAPAHDGDDVASKGFLLLGQRQGSSEQPAQVKRMYALGQLATGVAHELKNPMTSIMNYAAFLLKKYPQDVFDSRDRDRLQRIIEGVERMDQYIKDLVLLARAPEETEPESFDIHDVLTESLMLCDHLMYEHNIQVSREFEPTSLPMLGHRHLLVQVFVNLLSNAAHAMAERGESLCIQTSCEGGQLRVEIKDEGCGMSPEVQSRLFEPFFTTRKGRGGSGLGMVLVHIIVEQHRGHIHVESQVDVGTTFIVTLPQSASIG